MQAAESTEIFEFFSQRAQCSPWLNNFSHTLKATPFVFSHLTHRIFPRKIIP